MIDRQLEGFDVARIFAREQRYFSWNLNNPLRAPHDAARAAVIMEVTILVVVLITVGTDVAPWSTGCALFYFILYTIAYLVHPEEHRVRACCSHVSVATDVRVPCSSS